MKYLLALISSCVILSGCVTSNSAAYKNSDGTTQAACMDNCIERTGNQALCTKFAAEARGSCGDLIKKVCEAEKSGKCGG